MKAAAARHTGLPFVPQPAPDELLGSWLLRVAQLYGLGLKTLLSRLGALQAGDAHLPHRFSIYSSDVSLDVLAGATRVPRPALATMTTSTCGPRWPEELGPAQDACRMRRTPVATRMLARVHHVEDFGGVVQHVKAAQALLNCELPCAGDALWLQDLCNARTDVRLPWGKTRPNDLIRIVDGVARTLIAESNADDSACGPTANRRALAFKDFAFEPTAGQRAVTSVPTRLRQRQWVLARSSHVLRWAPEARKFQSTWSSTSIEQLTSMRGWPEGALAWVCPDAAGLVRRQDELRKQLSISPAYFRACSALLASIE